MTTIMTMCAQLHTQFLSRSWDDPEPDPDADAGRPLPPLVPATARYMSGLTSTTTTVMSSFRIDPRSRLRCACCTGQPRHEPMLRIATWVWSVVPRVKAYYYLP